MMLCSTVMVVARRRQWQPVPPRVTAVIHPKVLANASNATLVDWWPSYLWSHVLLSLSPLTALLQTLPLPLLLPSCLFIVLRLIVVESYATGGCGHHCSSHMHPCCWHHFELLLGTGLSFVLGHRATIGNDYSKCCFLGTSTTPERSSGGCYKSPCNGKVLNQNGSNQGHREPWYPVVVAVVGMGSRWCW